MRMSPPPRARADPIHALESAPRASSQHAPANCEYHQRVECRDDVVGHHSEAVMPLAIDQIGWRQLDDVEKAKQQEGDALVHRIVSDEEQHEKEGDDFVAYDPAMIGDAEVAPRTPSRPD